jgi:hypothetical protein
MLATAACSGLREARIRAGGPAGRRREAACGKGPRQVSRVDPEPGTSCRTTLNARWTHPPGTAMLATAACSGSRRTRIRVKSHRPGDGAKQHAGGGCVKCRELTPYPKQHAGGGCVKCRELTPYPGGYIWRLASHISMAQRKPGSCSGMAHGCWATDNPGTPEDVRSELT